MRRISLILIFAAHQSGDAHLFEFAELRFRPIEKDDLKWLHVWENDFETMMYNRSQPLCTISMSQFEERYSEWMKDEKSLNFIVENTALKEPIGTAGIHRDKWSNVPTATIGTYIGKKECWEKGFGTKITVALLEMGFIHLGLNSCQAGSVEYNTRAHRTLEACGFKKCGIVREVARAPLHDAQAASQRGPTRVHQIVDTRLKNDDSSLSIARVKAKEDGCVGWFCIGHCGGPSRFLQTLSVCN